MFWLIFAIFLLGLSFFSLIFDRWSAYYDGYTIIFGIVFGIILLIMVAMQIHEGHIIYSNILKQQEKVRVLKRNLKTQKDEYINECIKYNNMLIDIKCKKSSIMAKLFLSTIWIPKEAFKLQKVELEKERYEP